MKKKDDLDHLSLYPQEELSITIVSPRVEVVVRSDKWGEYKLLHQLKLKKTPNLS